MEFISLNLRWTKFTCVLFVRVDILITLLFVVLWLSTWLKGNFLFILSSLIAYWLLSKTSFFGQNWLGTKLVFSYWLKYFFVSIIVLFGLNFDLNVISSFKLHGFYKVLFFFKITGSSSII